MKSQYPSDLLNTTFKSMVFTKQNFNSGYTVSVSCSASATAPISVYESNGADPRDGGSLEPLATDDRHWWQITDSGVADGTQAFGFNRDRFSGKYVYVLIDASAGSMDDIIIHFNEA